MTEIAPRPYEPDVAVPPGATILELIEAKGMTQQQLAERMGRPPNKINEILHGKRAITVETALELELVLGLPAAYWLEREKSYQLAKARLAAEAGFQARSETLKKYPVAAMVKLGWIKRGTTLAAQIRELLAFFGVASPAQLDKPAVLVPSFRKSLMKQSCPYALAAWVHRGIREAERIDTQPFSAPGLRSVLPKLRALTTKTLDHFALRIVELCAAHGVAVVFVPHLPKTYASGAAFWVGDKAVVQLRPRSHEDGQFWFSFFHEVGHILLHGKKKAFLDDFKTDDSEQEREANAFAAGHLIPDANYARLADLLPAASSRR
ncbi:MAG TPA: addiction module antidote protein, HigA family [Planctomycetales bacterium]|jgi:addiction module HigA family antidote|nr:addiction module antidote protein, HigA family [Planctomycetales bacterium]